MQAAHWLPPQKSFSNYQEKVARNSSRREEIVDEGKSS